MQRGSVSRVKTKQPNDVRSIAVSLIERVEKEGAYSHLVLDAAIKDRLVPERDTALLTELVYGTIKRRNTLDYCLNAHVKKGVGSLQTWVASLLRMSLYQMIYLDRVPERAVLYEAVRIAKEKGHEGIGSLVNAVLRSYQRAGYPELPEHMDPLEKLSIEYSHPLWLLKEWETAYGRENTEAIAAQNLVPPRTNIRINRMKGSREDVIDKLEREGCETEPGSLSEDALVVLSGNVLMTKAYNDGFFTVQDESSMLVAKALDVSPDMTVLDACAAPGGKTTHIAEQMQNQGTVHAFDLHQKKLRHIDDQAERLGLSIITTKKLDARNILNEAEEQQYDRILIDAPCSGMGVIRRKPELKWNKQPEDLVSLPSIQYDILTEAAKTLKIGGRIVYSTCTVRPEENEQVVKAFLDAHPSFVRDDSMKRRLTQDTESGSEWTILPHDYETDGFYIAALERKG